MRVVKAPFYNKTTVFCDSTLLSQTNTFGLHSKPRHKFIDACAE
jgi:hypothetical protein